MPRFFLESLILKLLESLISSLHDNMGVNPCIIYSQPCVSMALHQRIQPNMDHVVLYYLLLKNIHRYVDQGSSNLCYTRVNCSLECAL